MKRVLLGILLLITLSGFAQTPEYMDVYQVIAWGDMTGKEHPNEIGADNFDEASGVIAMTDDTFDVLLVRQGDTTKAAYETIGWGDNKHIRYMKNVTTNDSDTVSLTMYPTTNFKYFGYIIEEKGMKAIIVATYAVRLKLIKEEEKQNYERTRGKRSENGIRFNSEVRSGTREGY